MEEEDHEKIFAPDARTAAELYMAQSHSSWEYPEQINVYVEELKPLDFDRSGIHRKLFEVYAGLVPEFSATEAEASK